MRFIARYAKEKENNFEVIDVFDTDTTIHNIPKDKPIIETLSRQYPSAVWFERKMHDDYGIIIKNAFDTRPLVHQERFPHSVHPMLKSFSDTQIPYSNYVPYKYEAISGDGVFQVAVGPIHAGIIEPGHFHFSQAGEGMLHQEVRHFYKYRAIEKMLEGKTLQKSKSIVERISGNESIAYQIAFIDIFAQSTKTQVSSDMKLYHAFLLELERVIHHLTDLGFIPNDAGFGSALAFCSKMAEDARRVMKNLTRSRFGFGGVDFNGGFKIQNLDKYLDKLQQDVDFFEDWILDIPSLWDRFDTTGVLNISECVKYGAVGIVARASGIVNDRRLNKFYLDNGFESASEVSGDVGARFKVRLREVKNSIVMMRNFLKANDFNIEPKDVQDGSYSSFVESSLGELFMSIEIKNGVIERFFVRDPSFINWQTLHLMMRADIIADFPLINKSCDLSYAGNDL